MVALRPGEILLAGGGSPGSGASSAVSAVAVGKLRRLRRADLEPAALALTGAAAAASSTDLFVAGGSNASGEPTGGLWRYRILDGTFSPPTSWEPTPIYRGGEWELLDILPEPVAGAGAALAGERFWLIGGERDGAPSTHVDIAAPDGSWLAGPDLPAPRDRSGVALLDTTLVVVGGAGDGLLATTLAWRLDTAAATPSFTAIAPLPAPRAALACRRGAGRCTASVDLRERGADQHGVALDSVLDAWSAVAPLPAPLAEHALVAAGDLLVTGGGSRRRPERSGLHLRRVAQSVDPGGWPHPETRQRRRGSGRARLARRRRRGRGPHG